MHTGMRINHRADELTCSLYSAKVNLSVTKSENGGYDMF
jgi:hypothetical protein